MNNDDELLYKQKYIKYKNKYLNLKNLEQQIGGVTTVEGMICFFTSTELANKVNEMFKTKAPKLDEIKTVLHNQAYMIKDGERDLELVLKSTLPFKKSELPDSKPKKVSISLSSFNRCDNNHINSVKSVLSPHNFIPQSMFVINIFRTGKNQFMSLKNLNLINKY